MRTGSPDALTPHRRGSGVGQAPREVWGSPCPPQQDRAPCAFPVLHCPSLPGNPGVGGSCPPHRGDGAPGDGGGGPPPTEETGRAVLGPGCGAVWLLPVKVRLTLGCPPPWAAPLPLSRDRDGRGAACSDGGTARTRCTHTAFPQCFQENKTRQNKNPQTQANKNKKTPQPQNTKYKQKTAFFFFNKQQTKLQFSVGCPCQPGRSAARPNQGSGWLQSGRGGCSFPPLLALRKVPRRGLRAPSPVLPRRSQLPRSTRPLWDPDTLRVPLRGHRAWETAGRSGSPAGEGWARGLGGGARPLSHSRSTHSL